MWCGLFSFMRNKPKSSVERLSGAAFKNTFSLHLELAEKDINRLVYTERLKDKVCGGQSVTMISFLT